jgi:hypothetical protein
MASRRKAAGGVTVSGAESHSGRRACPAPRDLLARVLETVDGLIDLEYR